jgi:hypothetical protein
MSELKKCPACGGEAKYIDKQVMCCKCSYTIFEHSSTESAIKAWNHQPRIEQLEQELKEAEKQRDALAELCYWAYSQIPPMTCTSNHAYSSPYTPKKNIVIHDKIEQILKGR